MRTTARSRACRATATLRPTAAGREPTAPAAEDWRPAAVGTGIIDPSRAVALSGNRGVAGVRGAAARVEGWLVIAASTAVQRVERLRIDGTRQRQGASPRTRTNRPPRAHATQYCIFRTSAHGWSDRARASSANTGSRSPASSASPTDASRSANSNVTLPTASRLVA